MPYATPIRIKKRGFTLLELMVAMVILTIALSIAFQAFSGTIRAWRRGTEVIDGLKHGDFAITQLSATIYSTIWFNSAKKTYAFDIEKDTANGFPADRISFVTASGSFAPANSPLANSPHRTTLFIDDDDYGEPALFAQAMPAISDYEEYEDEYDAEPFLVSSAIAGLEILVWDRESEDWTDEWEKENAVPERILLTLFVASDDKNEEPIAFTRMIEIPAFKAVELGLKHPSQSGQPGRTGGGANPGNRRRPPASNSNPQPINTPP